MLETTKAEIMTRRWVAISLRRISECPIVSRTALVPFRAALIGGKMEYSKPTCTFVFFVVNLILRRWLRRPAICHYERPCEYKHAKRSNNCQRDPHGKLTFCRCSREERRT